MAPYNYGMSLVSLEDVDKNLKSLCHGVQSKSSFNRSFPGLGKIAILRLPEHCRRFQAEEASYKGNITHETLERRFSRAMC